MRALSIVILVIGIASSSFAKKTKTLPAKTDPEPPTKEAEVAPAADVKEVKAAPAAEKPEETKAEEPAIAATNKVDHAAVGAKVTASSSNKEFEGEGGPDALVDGDLSTRWASEYSAPQQITIELEKPTTIDKIKMHWETAFATKYHIMVSDDGEGWTPAHFFFRMGEKKDVRIDTCNMKNVSAKYILIELNERVNPEWGFSLYEIEVIADSAIIVH